MKNKSLFLFRITLVAAIGGLLFGYDTAVISGAIGSVRTYFDLTSLQMGWAASSALVGCVIGSGVSGILSLKLGRKQSLILSAVLFAISAVGSAIPNHFTEFIIYRIIGGAGVGIASMLSPMYIAEVAPANARGKLVSVNQFAIVFGMVVVYFVNYYIAGTGDETWNIDIGWRWMFASETIPALLFLGLLFSIPESPRWLVLKQRNEKALEVLSRVENEETAKSELKNIIQSLKLGVGEKVSILASGIPLIIMIGIVLSILQQVTGINVFLYYAPEIFKKMGTASDTALLQTIIVGIVNMGFTVLAIFSVDRFGRKPLMIIGAAGMGISMISIGFASYYQNTDLWVICFILSYIAFFALSLGPITWVLLSEIFPNKVRGRAMAIAVAAMWISNFVVSQTFPMMMENEYLSNTFHGGFPFWVYGLMCGVSIWFTWRFIPETKGKSLEEIEKEIINNK